MKKLYIYLFILISGLALGSCDVLEGSYLENPDIVDPGEETIKKNVLVIEFTGHTCKSCPKAHKAITQLEEIYGERIVPVAVHTGYFARTQSGDKFNYDFRTSQGADMEAYFEFASFPIGVVGNLDKERLTSYSSWPSESSILVALESNIGINIVPEYDEESGTARINVNIFNKDAIRGEVNLAVYLIEDGIIAWQKDEDQDPIDVENYEHNHVFRTSAGSVWGTRLDQSDCSPNANAQITETILMDPSWVPENCSIVSFLYETESRDVMQCSIEKLIN